MASNTRRVTLGVFGDIRDLQSKLNWVKSKKDSLEKDGVNVPVDADTAKAGIDLDKLREKLSLLTTRANSVKIGADDKQAQAQMDSVRAKLILLDGKVTSPRVSLNGAARAMADLSLLDVALDKIGSKNASGSAGIGKLSGLFGELGSATETLGTSLPKLGLGLGVVAIAALALTGPVTAIAAGLAGFGIAAVPEVIRLKNALTETGKQGQQAYAALNPAEKGIVGQVRQLESSFRTMAKAVQPTVVKVFATALQGVRALMPSLGPLMQAGANGMLKMTQEFAKFAASPQVKQFLAILAQHAPAAMAAFGTIMIWGMRIIGGFIELSFNWGHNFSQLVQHIDAAANAVGRFGAAVGHGVGVGIAWFGRLASSVSGSAGRVSSVVAGIGNGIKRVFSSAGSWLINAGRDIINGLGRGLVAAWGTAWSWYTHINGWITGYFRSAGAWLITAGRNVIGGLGRGLVAAWNTTWSWFSHISGWIAGYYRSAGSWLINAGRAVITGLWNGLKNVWNTVWGWAGHIHQWIASVFGNARGWLVQAGKDVIQGLWDGFTSVWKKVTGWIGGLAGWIKAHKGPVSLDRKLLEPAGRALMEGLRVGLLGGFVPIKGIISGAAGTISNGFSGLSKLGLSGLKSVGGFFSKFFGGGGGSGVQQWAGLVSQALGMLHMPQSLAGRVLYQMQTESGGNPNAINLTDINAKNGVPSQGLMQVIPPTFAAYHVAGTSFNIRDPLANIAAAINYARSRYGPSLGALGSGHGYARGTSHAMSGWAVVGEQGPEMVNFRGGERVVPNKALGGNTYNVSVHVEGHALSSKQEIGREVATALGEFERRGGSVPYPRKKA
jgi:hypothetical protein